MPTERVKFVEFLEQLRDSDDRAALAALRRGLGKQPGTAVEMHRYVVPFLGADVTAWRESTHYLIASLFAFHPDPGGEGTLGMALAKVAAETASGSTELRFMGLLNSHPDDLAEHLRHAVSLARAKGVPVDWHQLFRDVLGWPSPDRRVQKKWARDFWSRTGEPEESTAGTPVQADA